MDELPLGNNLNRGTGLNERAPRLAQRLDLGLELRRHSPVGDRAVRGDS